MSSRKAKAVVAATVVVVLAGAAAWWSWRNKDLCRSCVEHRMEGAEEIPTAIAVASDGAVWVSIDSARSLGLLRNGKLERISIGRRTPEPVGLGVDGDGNAWLANPATVSILRITRSGEVTETALDTPIARLGRLAVGVDGSVWFAESTAYSFSRILGGKLTRHAISVVRGGPYGVAVSTDGTAWGTLQSGNKLVRITTDGTITEMEIPTRAGTPTDVAVAPDGSVWVLEFRANKVAHYHDGKFDEFDVGGEFAGLSGLTIAKDGSIWFGLLRRSALGCIKNGKMSTLKLPRADARPYTLAADQSGNVWYADISGVVGKVPESVVTSR